MRGRDDAAVKARDAWQEIEDKREPHYAEAQEQLLRAFGVQFDAAYRALRGAVSIDDIESLVSNAITDNAAAVRDAYMSIYDSVPRWWIQHGYESIREQAAGKAISEWVLVLLERIARLAGERITLVNGTTRTMVQRILRTVIPPLVDRGEGMNAIIQALRPALEEIDPRYGAYWRTEAVARTEVVGLSNLGNKLGAEQAADELGLEIVKEWISAQDYRTRRLPDEEYDHLSMHLTRVDRGKPFVVPSRHGPVELDYPGALDGAPGNVINCRCGIRYVPADDIEINSTTI